MLVRTVCTLVLACGMIGCGDSPVAPSPAPSPTPLNQPPHQQYPKTWLCNFYGPDIAKQYFGVNCVCPNGPNATCYSDDYPNN